MTRKEALEALLSKVEAGEWPGGIDGIARQVFPYKSARYDDHGLLAAEAFDGSLDAAKALHEAVLPGYGYSFGPAHGCVVSVADRAMNFPSTSDNPARAWLISILKALIAQEGEE